MTVKKSALRVEVEALYQGYFAEVRDESVYDGMRKLDNFWIDYDDDLVSMKANRIKALELQDRMDRVGALLLRLDAARVALSQTNKMLLPADAEMFDKGRQSVLNNICHQLREILSKEPAPTPRVCTECGVHFTDQHLGNLLCQKCLTAKLST